MDASPEHEPEPESAGAAGIPERVPVVMSGGVRLPGISAGGGEAPAPAGE